MINSTNEDRRQRRGVGSSLLWVLAAIVILGLVAIYTLGDWEGPRQNTAQNNQTTTETVAPKTVDQDQPANTQSQPSYNGTDLPAQPAQPEKSQNTTQP